MDTTMIRKEDVTLDKLIARFIKYTETNVINVEPNDDKVVSLDQFKQAEKEKNEVEGHMDFIAINTGDAIFDIIVAKVRMATSMVITDAESIVGFADTFEIFKESVTHSEEVYKKEDKNIYELPLFMAVDVITSVTASKIIEIFLSNPETLTNQQ
jgi:hypothetical protein